MRTSWKERISSRAGAASAMIVYTAGACVLSACTTTSNAKSGINPAISAATLTYKLPTTTVTVGLDLTITKCSPTVETRIVPTTVVTATASKAPSDSFVLRGQDLASWTKSRDITVALYDNGTIKTVSGASGDQTGAIITSALGTALSIAKFAAAPAPPNGVSCSPGALKAMQQIETLQDGLEALKTRLVSNEQQISAKAVQGQDTTALQKDSELIQSSITAIATQIASIQMSSAAHLSLPAKEISIASEGGFIKWDAQSFNSLLSYMPLGPNAPADLAEVFKVGYCVNPLTDQINGDACKASGAVVVGSQKLAPTSGTHDCGSDSLCSRTLVFRDPVDANLILLASGIGFSQQQNKVIQQEGFPIAQWGGYSYLAFDVGFGENRTVQVALDAFGRKTSLGWKSDARAANIFSSASNIAAPASTLITTLNGSEAANQAAEVSKLSNQQKLNQLKKCQAILDAGGFVCPTS